MANRTNTRCAEYYKVKQGDTCSKITINASPSISLDDFLFLNPSVDGNCSNLIPGESYCIQAVGDISTYSGYRYVLSHINARFRSLTVPDLILPAAAPAQAPHQHATATGRPCRPYTSAISHLQRVQSHPRPHRARARVRNRYPFQRTPHSPRLLGPGQLPNASATPSTLIPGMKTQMHWQIVVLTWRSSTRLAWTIWRSGILVYKKPTPVCLSKGAGTA